jgi:hypothetical protein
MATQLSAVEERESFAVYKEIAAAVQPYVDGARSGSSALMRKAFVPGAHIRGTYNSELVEWTLSEFCDLLDKHGSADELAAQIVQIDHNGTAGMVRLEAENWRGTRYTDFLLLLKIGADWKITSKVFFAHSRA